MHDGCCSVCVYTAITTCKHLGTEAMETGNCYIEEQKSLFAEHGGCRMQTAVPSWNNVQSCMCSTQTA